MEFVELRIKQKAKEKRVKISDIAARLGISRQSLHNSLTGNITVARLTELARILDCSIYELIQPEPGFDFIYDEGGRFKGLSK